MNFQWRTCLSLCDHSASTDSAQQWDWSIRIHDTLIQCLGQLLWNKQGQLEVCFWMEFCHPEPTAVNKLIGLRWSINTKIFRQNNTRSHAWSKVFVWLNPPTLGSWGGHGLCLMRFHCVENWHNDNINSSVVLQKSSKNPCYLFIIILNLLCYAARCRMIINKNFADSLSECLLKDWFKTIE